MRSRPTLAVLAAAVSLIAGGAGSAQTAKESAGQSQGQAMSAYTPPPAATEGYLPLDRLPDAVRMLGPPPGEGSGTLAGDIATYEATRALEGTPRWALANRDSAFGPPALLDAYACALGLRLDRQTAPALFRLLTRVVASTEAIQRHTKTTFQRRRPFVDHPGKICVPVEDWLKNGYAYPSGHSTYGWVGAMILAEIAPDQASAVMARGRSYAESRVVCGVHYTSDIQASRLVAASLFSVLRSSPAFRADLAQARREVAAKRGRIALKPDAGQCGIEAEATATPVW